MKTPNSQLVSGVLILSLAGCMSIPSGPLEGSSAIEPTELGAWQDSQPNGGSVLYARDGSPVTQPKPGVVIEIGEPVGHPLEEAGGSRLVLLDLYQIAVDERDELGLEVQAMTQSMTSERARYAELERRFQEMEAKFEVVRSEKGQLEVQNLDLAARLTTAQIRRLEAEKLLLEVTLETQDAQ
ncbi:MAG: hypothetical protein GY711_04360 [bacterium]|nr:hypothetical protein [bacterium]